jgi:predicted transposase/invertase (TIGR01784 family)
VGRRCLRRRSAALAGPAQERSRIVKTASKKCRRDIIRFEVAAAKPCDDLAYPVHVQPKRQRAFARTYKPLVVLSAIGYRGVMRPVFADPKTDVIFKKIFGQPAHKDLLIQLLDSLLELDAAHRIVDLEYLSLEQLPPRKDLKLSMLDVKCFDAKGTWYVVEMQVIEVEGFQKRIVYNACKAYTTQLGVGDDYPQLNDVVAVTICDFVLWDDRNAEGGYRVPMVSHWSMREEHGGAKGLGEVRYVFLELPKYTAGSKPKTTGEKWAHFFRSAPRLQSIPKELAKGPWARALEVARTANLSAEEWTEYEREKMAEQDFRGGLSLAEKRGEQRGKDLGELLGRILEVCEVLGIEVTEQRRAHLEGLDLQGLSELRERIKSTRSWP